MRGHLARLVEVGLTVEVVGRHTLVCTYPPLGLVVRLSLVEEDHPAVLDCEVVRGCLRANPTRSLAAVDEVAGGAHGEVAL